MKTINIGLNNNPKTSNQILELLSSYSSYTVISSKLRNGTYVGEIEPTLVVNFECRYARVSTFLRTIENLCLVLEQECIPVSCDEFDIMVFSPKYKGDKFKFDERCFIR